MLEKIKKIFTWGKNTYDKLYSLFVDKSIIAVNVTAKFKKIVENPATDAIADIIGMLIPGDIDEKLYDTLKINIPIIAEKIAIAHGILIESETKSDALTAIIEKLGTTFPAIKTSFWIMFSAELNIALADGKLSLWESISLTQRVFGEIKKNK